jgi:hypothetical protein
MGKVIRNEADFPFLFVENHIDGKDYLMCAEDYQGFTIICITDGKKWDYVAEKSKRDLALRITDFHLSPNKMSLAIEGHAKGKPSDIVETDEVHFFLINEITKLPYKEVENDERIIISRIEDYIMPTGICLDDVQNQEERLVYLKSGNIKKQTAYYAYSPKSGVMEKVFSEWR